jgi:prepilin-type processing-associated H-X9-DG protein
MTWTPALDPELEATLASVVERTGSIDLLPQHRHRGMINLAFADGHVASLDSSDPGALTRTRLLPIR